MYRLFNTFLLQFDKKKEIEAVNEERELIFACYILDIYYSLNRIH